MYSIVDVTPFVVGLFALLTHLLCMLIIHYCSIYLIIPDNYEDNGIFVDIIIMIIFSIISFLSASIISLQS